MNINLHNKLIIPAWMRGYKYQNGLESINVNGNSNYDLWILVCRVSCGKQYLWWIANCQWILIVENFKGKYKDDHVKIEICMFKWEQLF